jgi:multidrug efflux pump
MQADNLQDLVTYSPKMLEKLRSIHGITDVNSDLQNQGLQAMVTYDRATAARFGITPQLIDNTLYDAFGQRQVSTMYTSLNQYHVVMEAAPEFWQNPQFLREVYVSAPASQQSTIERTGFLRSGDGSLDCQSSGPFPRGYHIFQPGSQCARRCGKRNGKRRGGHRSSQDDPYIVRGNGTGLSGFSGR